MSYSSEKQTRAHLLGIGLDNQDGHKRITRAESFSIVGGSEETHDKMTETLLKTCEDLKKSGSSVEETHPEKLGELIQYHTPR